MFLKELPKILVGVRAIGQLLSAECQPVGDPNLTPTSCINPALASNSK